MEHEPGQDDSMPRSAIPNLRRTWSRRLVTLPLLFAILSISLGLFPLWMLLSFFIDCARRTFFFPTCRGTLFFAFFVLSQAYGVSAASILFIAKIICKPSLERWWKWNRKIQDQWTQLVFSMVKGLFSIRIQMEDEAELKTAPFILLVRHASIVDTLFPAVFVSIPWGVPLRYILKDGLLWDPSFDIVGNRIPNCFVRRGSQHTDDEKEKLRTLAQTLPAPEGIVIFPEGTRFTSQKRRKILEHASRTKNQDLLDEVQTLQHVLPLRRSGVMALLEYTSCDIVFCAHSGFEGISTLAHVWDGSLVGREIHVRIWRMPRPQLSQDLDVQWKTLCEEWKNVDAFIDERKRSLEDATSRQTKTASAP